MGYVANMSVATERTITTTTPAPGITWINGWKTWRADWGWCYAVKGDQRLAAETMAKLKEHIDAIEAPA